MENKRQIRSYKTLHTQNANLCTYKSSFMAIKFILWCKKFIFYFCNVIHPYKSIYVKEKGLQSRRNRFKCTIQSLVDAIYMQCSSLLYPLFLSSPLFYFLLCLWWIGCSIIWVILMWACLHAPAQGFRNWICQSLFCDSLSAFFSLLCVSIDLNWPNWTAAVWILAAAFGVRLSPCGLFAFQPTTFQPPKEKISGLMWFKSFFSVWVCLSW